MSEIETWLESIHKGSNKAATEMARGFLDLLSLRNVSHPESYEVTIDDDLIFFWESKLYSIAVGIMPSGMALLLRRNKEHDVTHVDTVQPRERYPSWFIPLIKSIDKENGK